MLANLTQARALLVYSGSYVKRWRRSAEKHSGTVNFWRHWVHIKCDKCDSTSCYVGFQEINSVSEFSTHCFNHPKFEVFNHFASNAEHEVCQTLFVMELAPHSTTCNVEQPFLEARGQDRFRLQVRERAPFPSGRCRLPVYGSIPLLPVFK